MEQGGIGECGSGTWEGGDGGPAHATRPEIEPDFGPSHVDPRVGVATVGAGPWVVNCNVPLNTPNLATARDIARRVSERGGGLPLVEAMGLPHGTGEILPCPVISISDRQSISLFSLDGCWVKPYTSRFRLVCV